MTKPIKIVTDSSVQLTPEEIKRKQHYGHSAFSRGKW